MPEGTAIAKLTLPDDLSVCHGMIRELLTVSREQRQTIDQLQHKLDLVLKRLFGPRADRVNPDQLSLFDEPLPEAPPPLPVVDTTESPVKKNGHGRRSLPSNLPRETQVIDIPQAEKLALGGTWTKIGEEITERLDLTPAQVFVHRLVRPKYIVHFDDQSDQHQIAALPPEALPKAKAAPGLIADVIVGKCVDHLPLYRQEKRYSRHGIDLARSTLCDWLAEAAEVLTPLYLLLKARVLSAKAVHTDDTPIPVQDPALDHCRTGRIWTYVSGGGVVYDATENRCRDGPLEFLKDFRGYLQCDAYAGYDELFRASDGKVIEVGCWAHARRKFVEAEKTSPHLAAEAVARIGQLYVIEHAAKELETAARTDLRQQQARPLLDALKQWLERQRIEALPQTPLADAINYALNQWAALTVYVTDGDLAIDNNVAERAIKPFAIGRKNWLFFGSDRGGRTLAILSSFTATCELLKINPWTYLRDTLRKLPTTPAVQLATLLPAR